MSTFKCALLLTMMFGFSARSEGLTLSHLEPEGTHRNELIDKSTVINGPLYIVSNNSLTTASYPNLDFVNGPIYIVNNSRLVEVNFPKLRYVNGPIYISYNHQLETVTYPTLIFVNGPVYFYENRE